MYFKMAPKDGPPTKPIPEMPMSPESMMGQEEATDNPAVAAEGSPQDEMGQESPGSIDPSIAGYMGAEYGPFECQRCVHWLAPNACQVVAGNIDPQGCCNVFTPGQEQESAESPEMESQEQEEAPEQGGGY